MSDDNKPADDQAPESTTDENAEAAAADPVENTGANEPAADSIEAAAETAAAESEPDPEPEPEPPVEEPPAAQDKPKKAGATPASKRVKRKPGPKATDTKASQDHLAAKKASRPEAPPPPEPTDEEKAEAEAKAENRARLREIKEQIAELDADRAALVEEQQVLASFGQPVPDNRPHHVRHQEVLKRSREMREQRKNDRLKLLAASAGKSPLDRALGERPRQSMAAADADKTE